MRSEPIFRQIVDGLAAAGIPYVVVGSLAANAYGIVRSTLDVDIVVETQPGHIAALMAALGSEFELEPQMSFETVTGTQKRLIRDRASEFVIELFHLSSEPHDQERFARRRQISILDRQVWVLWLIP